MSAVGGAWTRQDFRRQLLAASACALAAAPAPAEPQPLMRTLPTTGEAEPAIGLGSWITFNVGAGPEGRAAAREVLRAFFATGGSVVDSSPIYGSAQDVIGGAVAAATAVRPAASAQPAGLETQLPRLFMAWGCHWWWRASIHTARPIFAGAFAPQGVPARGQDVQRRPAG